MGPQPPRPGPDGGGGAGLAHDRAQPPGAGIGQGVHRRGPAGPRVRAHGQVGAGGAHGDFSNPPDPTAPEDRSLPLPSSFDPARSVIVDAETTPTRLVYQDPSGSDTAVINQQPVRFERDGAWVDIDSTLVAGPDETLVARAAPTGARLGTRSAGAVATVDAAAGPIVLRHAPGAPSVAATTKDNTATYPGALGEGRDLALSLTGDGFEEKVVLATAGTSGTYHDHFVSPPA